MDKVYVVCGTSESGDHYVAVFAKKPTDTQLSELAHNWDGGTPEEGPGYDGSYCHLEITEEKVR